MSNTERVTWIQVGSKKILYVDYNGLHGNSLLDTFHLGKDTVIAANSPVLLMVNFKDAKLDNDFLSAAKSVGQSLNNKYEKSGLFGLSGIQKILYSGYIRVTGQGSKMKIFKTKEECTDWLVSD